jgi:energy-coupling factor transport system ATP-binding protein
MPIVVEHISHIYNPGTPFESRALEDVSLEIADGGFYGLIGPTGSGKSTLIQHLNGLLKPTRGRVLVDGADLGVQGTNLREIRQKVGLIFQYPEHQLFEETVGQDIGYGPKNLGLPSGEVEERVQEAAAMVGLDPDILKRSPFELSGGQARRVAIAGILAMRPKILILDEPTAGLDPRGRNDILGRIASLHRDHGLTVVLVSHSMEDVARLAQRLLVMHRGRLWLEGSPETVFSRAEELKAVGLAVPAAAELMQRLRARGWSVREDVFTPEGAVAEIRAVLQRTGTKAGAGGGAGRA